MSQLDRTSPRLLVSVRDSREVEEALAGGADWIDLKEPHDGPLAAVSASTARTAVKALSGRRTLSAALGELRDWRHPAACELLAVGGIGVIKLGLAGCGEIASWQSGWADFAETARRHQKQLAAVIYADWRTVGAPPPEEVLSVARAVGCRYLLIDTADKRGGATFEHLPPSSVAQLFLTARSAGMTTALAGKMSLATLIKIPTASVDIVAVRGAVCRGDRTAAVDRRLVAEFRQALRERCGSRPTRLPTARGIVG